MNDLIRHWWLLPIFALSGGLGTFILIKLYDALKNIKQKCDDSANQNTNTCESRFPTIKYCTKNKSKKSADN